MKQFIKFAVEIGPLVVFFIANGRWGLMPATAAFMVATLVSVPTAWILQRRLPVMPLVSGVFVLGFGGLTLALDNEIFIKLKPTIVNLLFAAILTGGLIFRLSLLQKLFDSAFQLTARGWHLLTVRWILFFVVLAVLNEVVWRTQSTETWIQFKLFGIMPLTLVFSLSLVPLITKHASAEDDAEEPAE